MAKNITWCLVRSIFYKTNFINSRCASSIHKCFNHEVEEYKNSPIKTFTIDYGDVKTYKQFLNVYKACPNAAISALMAALNVTKENATKIVNDRKIFGTLSASTIMKNNYLLHKAGVKKSTLRDNMYALADTTSNLNKKVKAIQFIEIEINNAVPLLQLSVMALKEFANVTKNDRKYLKSCSNRIIYLSNQLQTDIYTLCMILNNASYMLKMSIDKLIKITEYLLEMGMPQEKIIKDLIIYRYAFETIKTKCEYAKHLGISVLKPWMVRCPVNLIQKTADRNNLRQIILEDSKTIPEYISQVLHCNVETANALIKRDPSITSIRIEKLSAVLPFLHDHGYTIEEIYRSPRALHSRPKTMQNKYERWIQLYGKKPSLSYILLSENLFNKQLKTSTRKKK